MSGFFISIPVMDFEIAIKKRKCYKEDEEEDDQPLNRLSCLPHDIALDILSRLPIKSVIQFRFSCRSWNFLSRDLQLVDMHMSRALICQRLCLIFHSDYPIRNQLHFVEFSDVDDNEIVRKIDTPFAVSMPEFNVIGSCNGLLCLIDSLFSDSIYIYNPFTRDYKLLPKFVEFENQIVIFGFGFHPITKRYKVIKIVYYPSVYNLEIPRHVRRFTHMSSRRSDVQIYNLGTDKWRSIGQAPYRLEKRSSLGVLVSGKLHWMSHWGKYNGRRNRIIVSFDLSDDSFQEIPGPNTGNLRSLMNCHVAVLGGCLCAVLPSYGGNGGHDIWVMKEYGVKESWVKEFTLGVYSPRFIRPDMQKSYQIWRKFLGGRLVRIVCLLKSGDILVEYRGGTLVSYNPDSGMFKNIAFQGMPKMFQTIVHIGSLYPVVQS
ncbi:F-box At3g07870-like [Olea europaea subsp. europaea]|uniref:F-box At3g07870-like n=1 Tax=Olea europaea subsp. europaea TaxID=158383 RepID=A0A8S0RHA1_OLEEU|nr:F-box At3g07870-like [Olea europaea subsp. europaea]